jgi:cobyrinic acid a,c-diamide synthase
MKTLEAKPFAAQHLSRPASYRIDIPRLLIAGVSSGVGKTTFVVGLVQALRARGLRVAVFKCGPDYLDPTYHARAAGRTSHNLDGWMMGRDAVVGTFLRATSEADIAILEGVMGLFDGASASADEGSTAEIAKWLNAPVLLVVDASGMARSVGAIGRGFAAFDPEVRVAGLICNRVGSESHLTLLRAAASRPPVLGGLPKNPSGSFPERHLGLRTADERCAPDALLRAWSEIVRDWCDLDAIVALANSAGVIAAHSPSLAAPKAEKQCTIAVAFDEAFHFYYEDNLGRLASAGATLVRFSPIHDPHLPPLDGLYIGGGYPEVYAADLAANASMRRDIATFAAAGGAVYAECGGMMYLCSELHALDGAVYPMCGVLPARTEICQRLQALGYVEAESLHDSILGNAGLRFRGHQFRYSRVETLGEIESSFIVKRRRDAVAEAHGFQIHNTIASYIHAHWASNPAIVDSLIAHCTTKGGKQINRP